MDRDDLTLSDALEKLLDLVYQFAEVDTFTDRVIVQKRIVDWYNNTRPSESGKDERLQAAIRKVTEGSHDLSDEDSRKIEEHYEQKYSQQQPSQTAVEAYRAYEELKWLLLFERDSAFGSGIEQSRENRFIKALEYLNTLAAEAGIDTEGE